MEIIPAIDIIDGSCVRLTQGNYGEKTLYHKDPLYAAKQFADAGLRRLHLVDLDGARTGSIVNYRILERIADQTDLVIDFGGGIKRDEDIRIAFNSGAAMVTGGSVAVKAPDLFLRWLSIYGSDKIILGADAQDRHISVSGWTEQSQIEIIEFIEQYLRRGIRKVISTDIGKDGMMQGPAIELYQDILNRVHRKKEHQVELIASGGVSSEGDLEALEAVGVAGVIIGKALYEGAISLAVLSAWQQKHR